MIDHAPDLVEAFTFFEVYKFMVINTPHSIVIKTLKDLGWDTTELEKLVTANA